MRPLVADRYAAMAGALYRRRREAGVSRAVLARRVGVSSATIEEWETGAAIPNAVQFMAWHEYLDLTASIGPFEEPAK